MSDGPELAGQRALVTGGTKGICHAVAMRLHDAGAVSSPRHARRPNCLLRTSYLWPPISLPRRAAGPLWTPR